MLKWAVVVGLLLAVPVFAIGVAKGVQAHSNSELRAALHKEYPGASEAKLDEMTVDRLCEGRRAALQDLCEDNDILNLMGQGSIGAGAVGLTLLLLIMLAGTVARQSRWTLLVLFRPGLYLTVITLIGLILVHAALAITAIYYGESALTSRVHVGVIATIAIGAAFGVVAMARSSFSLVSSAHTFVVGRTLSRADAPSLWGRIDATADRLGALRPQSLVVGLDPNFFVTEADVTCLNGKLTGRTLYCSLPLCRILDIPELTSIIGHELGHFKGEDTKFSKHFYPIYRGTTESLAALSAAGAEGSRSIALLPAIAVLSYFLECFSVAERRLGRERELAADQAGASVTSEGTIATALVKIHAFAGIWLSIQQAALKAVQQQKVYTNVSRFYADVVSRNASPEILNGIAETHLSHPTDSHPPLSVRLGPLHATVAGVATGALAVTPVEPAISLISGADQKEEEISEAFQVILARNAGISLGTPSQGAESQPK